MLHERYFALAEHVRWLDEEPGRVYAKVVRPARAKMADRIAASAASATDVSLAKADLPRPSLETLLAGDLTDELMRSYVRGRRSLLMERRSQLSGAPPSMHVRQEEFDFEPTSAQRSWVKRLAQVFSALMVKGMIDEASRAGMVSRNADRSEAEQRVDAVAAILALSEPVLEADLGGSVNQAFSNGRNEQAASMGEEISSAFYSAIMDEATCGPCEVLDGEQHEPGDAEFVTPNPDCEGGARCRCVTIYVFREDQAA